MSGEEIFAIYKEYAGSIKEDSSERKAKRHMEPLVELGLIKKIDGGNFPESMFYLFSDPIFYDEYYPAKREHSRRLIPGLKGLINEPLSEEEKQVLTQSRYSAILSQAKKHLRCYEFGAFIDYDRMEKAEEYKRNIVDYMQEKYERYTHKELIQEKNRVYGLLKSSKHNDNYVYDKDMDTLLANDFGLRLYNHLVVENTGYKMVGKDNLVLDNEIVAQNPSPTLLSELQKDLLTEMKTPTKISKRLFSEAHEHQKKFTDQVSNLIEQIEGGDYLKGECPGCPQIRRHRLERF